MSFLDSIMSAIDTLKAKAIEAERQRLEGIFANISDPFAREIEWTPLVRGGSSFGTHDISINPQGILEFQASTSSKIFAGVFIIGGLLFGLMSLLSLSGSPNIDFTAIILFFPPAIFIGIGYIMYRYISKPIIFDKQSGYFYKEKPQMTYGMIDPTNRNIIPLSSIHALQIVSERVSTKNSSFLSYEINLILSDKKRINVVDHGNLEKIQADVKQLGEYLGVPVWGV